MAYGPNPAERSRQRHIVLEAIHYRPLSSREGQARLRAWQALMMSPNPDVWSQLLQGNPVPTDQIDPHALRRTLLRRVK